MPGSWERRLSRWALAGVVDAETAERIREYERTQATSARTRWSVWIALLFGTVLLGAGVLLLVSSVWDSVPPMGRVVMVVAMVVSFHAAGAIASGLSEKTAFALHAVGTALLGPGLFLAGQVLALDEHWPSAVMLWAIGALAGWLVRRDAAQFALVAVLVPAWLLCEWAGLAETVDLRSALVAEAGAFLLALAYLTTRPDSPRRALAPGSGSGSFGDSLTPHRVLAWLGAIAFLPASIVLGVQAGIRISPHPWYASLPPLRSPGRVVEVVAWALALALPLAVAAVGRGRAARVNAAAALWVVVLALLPVGLARPWLYAWLALGTAGLAAWGVRELRPGQVNLATGCFALVVLFFYFDNLLDKLGRSVSLIGLGLLCLAGGYLLERVRKRMLVRAGGGKS